MWWHLVSVNIVNVLELILIFVIKFVYSDTIFWMFLLVWLVQAVYTNYLAVRHSRSVSYRLRVASRGAFDDVVESMTSLVVSLESRAKVFDSLDKGDRYMDVYGQVRNQFYANINTMVRYMSIYDRTSENCESVRKKIFDLVAYNRSLISKLDAVAEHVVTLDSTVGSADMVALDSLIESLKEMIAEGND